MTLPLVMLPGMDGTGLLLRALAEKLQVSRPTTVLAYPTDQPLDAAALTAFVIARLPTPCVLLGESFSGPIAVEVANRAPQVKGLILACTFLRYPTLPGLALAARAIDPRRVPARFRDLLLLGADRTPELSKTLTEALTLLDRRVLQMRLEAVCTMDARARFGALGCPVLSLRANQDRLVPVRCAPPCESVDLDGPHMLLATRIEAVATAVEDFCRRNGL